MPFRIRGVALLATLSIVIAALSACGSSDSEAGSSTEAPERLRIALLPDENASEIIKNNEPLKSYLEQRLDVEVELVVTTDYSSMIEAMSRGRLELAYFGPLSYVLAKQRGDIEPFAALQEDEGQPPTYQSVFVANPETTIDSLDDVLGKTVVWGDSASTSSHLIPKAMLAEAGMTVDEDYDEQYVGAHDAVALAVQNGNADAGGLSKPIYERLVADGVVDPSKVAVIKESKPYPNYPWTMRSDFPADFKAKVRAAFLELNDPSVLEPFDAAGFGPVTDADYNVVRDLAPLLGIDLADFQ